ncbi:MAG TPA: methyl-accepting chemotaxis protein [Spirochaetota bacterium]|nr:methyl-accepting chemotaxis protein [Spirochaetota bacterium]
MARCERYDECPFFKLFDGKRPEVQKKWRKKYCTDNAISKKYCQRLKYYEREKKEPLDNYTPSGSYMTSKLTYNLTNAEETQEVKVPFIILGCLLGSQLMEILVMFGASFAFGFFETTSNLIEYMFNPGLIFFFYPGVALFAVACFLNLKKLVAGYNRGEVLDYEILKFARIWIVVQHFVLAGIPMFQPETLKLCSFTLSPVNVFGIKMTNVYSIFSLAIIFNILFIAKLEEFIKFLPFLERHKNMSLRAKFLVVTGTVILSIGALFAALMANFYRFGQGNFFAYMSSRFLRAVLLAGAIAMVDINLLLSSISKRLSIMKDFSANMVNGDYTSPHMPILSREEIGSLMDDMNIMLDTTKHTIAGILGILESVKSSKLISQSLVSNVNETVNITEQMNRNIETVKQSMESQAAAVGESATAIEQITRNIESLNNNIETQSATIVESASSIEEMVANIRSVSNILNENAGTMKELLEESSNAKELAQNATSISAEAQNASEGLLEAADVIQNIASQTNLLAMNAAIEAAHAGDYGKGFAVVADEIRKLAEESNEQGKTISNVLQSLKDKIAGISTATTDVDNQFIQMQEKITKLDNQESVIQNAMREQASGGAELLEAIKQISYITENVKSGSAEMLIGSREISNEMTKLVDFTGEINRNMDLMLAGTKQIASAVQEISEVAETNEAGIDKLDDITKTLKV